MFRHEHAFGTNWWVTIKKWRCLSYRQSLMDLENRYFCTRRIEYWPWSELFYQYEVILMKCILNGTCGYNEGKASLHKPWWSLKGWNALDGDCACDIVAAFNPLRGSNVFLCSWFINSGRFIPMHLHFILNIVMLYALIWVFETLDHEVW